MQVSVEDVSTVKKILRIEVPEEEVANRVNAAYDDLRKNAKIKGFRPGKVPRSVLERLYKKDLHADVASKLIQESFADAIKQTNLHIIEMPQIDPPELKPESAYQYEVSVEVKPFIEDVNFKGLRLKKHRYQVSEGEIEAQLQMLRRNLVQYKPISEDRPVQDGDIVVLDYEGFVNDAPAEQARKTDNYMMKIGKAQISPDLDKAMIGMRRGDMKEIQVKIDEKYPNPGLAGLDIKFHVTLKDIREEFLPELDDVTVKQFGNYQTLEELKTEIRKNLTAGYEKRVEHELQEQIFSALLEKVTFDVPESLVKYELDNIVFDTERRLSYQNMSLQDVGLTREGLSEKYRDTAVKQVKRYLLLGKLIEQEKPELSDEEMNAGYADVANALYQPVREIKEYYSQNLDKLEQLKHTLLEKKIVKQIIEASEIEEIEPETTIPEMAEPKSDVEGPGN